MELIRGLYNLQPHHRHCAATIGSFDGVHGGHQAVIRALQQAAAQQGLPVTLVTFEPLPREYFCPDEAPPRLTRLREKILALSNCGVERVLCLRFDARLAELPAADFIRQVLVEGLDVRYLLVGDDFRFGKERAGNFRLLQQAGRQLDECAGERDGGQKAKAEPAHVEQFRVAGETGATRQIQPGRPEQPGHNHPAQRIAQVDVGNG